MTFYKKVKNRLLYCMNSACIQTYDVRRMPHVLSLTATSSYSNPCTHRQLLEGIYHNQISSSRLKQRLIMTMWWFVLYLLHGPPPSPPGRAPRPGSSSSSARVWRGSMATCLRAAPPWTQTGMGTATPPTSRSGRTAR